MSKNLPAVIAKKIVAKISNPRHDKVDEFLRKLCEENPGYIPSAYFVNALKEDSFTEETYAAYDRARHGNMYALH